MNKRQLGGLKAKQFGSAFEELFTVACNRSGMSCVRIPDGCRQYYDKRSGRLALTRVQSPFDFLIARDGLAAVLDTKTVDAESFKFSDIVEHQLKSLLSVGHSLNAGYLVWFRPLNLVVWYSCFRLAKVQPNTSLKPEDGLALGAVEEFDCGMILKWVDDGKNAQPVYQQRLL